MKSLFGVMIVSILLSVDGPAGVVDHLTRDATCRPAMKKAIRGEPQATADGCRVELVDVEVASRNTIQNGMM